MAITGVYLARPNPMAMTLLLSRLGGGRHANTMIGQKRQITKTSRLNMTTLLVQFERPVIRAGSTSGSAIGSTLMLTGFKERDLVFRVHNKTES